MDDLIQGEDDLEDFFEDTINGYATAHPDGRLLRINRRLCGWLGVSPDEVSGRPFSEFLPIGGRMFFETHLAPLLRMQGFFDEVAIELKGADGSRVPVFLNAMEHRDEAGHTRFVRLTVFKATDRRRYEENLREARQALEHILDNERETARLREQFIAVLGHDLRNPLSAIASGADMLLRLPIEQRAAAITTMIKGSVKRMSGLIDDVMDFARGRLGGGIGLNRVPTDLGPALRHVVDELRTAHPTRSIETDIDLSQPVSCDPDRLSQLLSNLLANAITHGSPEGPIHVFAGITDDTFSLWVGNTGKPIPAEAMERLFKPFEREEVRASRNGLGLGLYIASEIARSHGGVLGATSSDAETRFTFTMPMAE